MLADWAQEWLNEKAAEGLTAASLYRYERDLEIIDLDISKATLQEIKGRLAACSAVYGRGSLRHICIATKQVLRQVGRESDAKLIKLPKHPEPRVVVYSESEIQALQASCRNLREWLLVTINAETGARRGELFNMRIRDVYFDEYSAILWLHGKTGTRTRRVYSCVPEIQTYLLRHPHGDEAEAKFWLNKYGRPLAYQGVYKSIHRIGMRALNRYIYSHGFRHTAATKDVKSYTDREMMIRYGWSRPDMVAVYAHLTGRDVDEKDLALHGFVGSNPTRMLQDASELKVTLPNEVR